MPLLCRRRFWFSAAFQYHLVFRSNALSRNFDLLNHHSDDTTKLSSRIFIEHVKPTNHYRQWKCFCARERQLDKVKVVGLGRPNC